MKRLCHARHDSITAPNCAVHLGRYLHVAVAVLIVYMRCLYRLAVAEVLL